jgi:hypothetical protein
MRRLNARAGDAPPARQLNKATTRPLEGTLMTTTAAASRTSEIAIFGRLIKSDDGDLSRDLARYILTIGFGEEDQGRMRDLAARNQVGGLSPEEREELHNYVKAGHLLALLHSKARKSLHQKQVS